MKLDTERLVIRSAVASDAPDLQRLFSDPEVRRYLPPGEAWTLERANEAIARRAALEHNQGYTAWIVMTKAGQFIGSVALQKVERTGPEVELAYHYLPSAWGKGYGTEAAIAVLRHGFDSVGLDEIIAICIPDNIGSWRIMEKAGMRYVGIASYYGLAGLKKYVARRDEWGA